MAAGRKFTPTFISRIPLREKGQGFFWDSQVVGLGLVVGKTAKSYVAQYRGKRITLGRTDVLTLDEARTKTLEYIRSIQHGEDPCTERAVARSRTERLAALTLRTAMEETIAAKAQFARPRTLAIYRSSIELYLPEWLDRPLHTITAGDVGTRFAEIADGRNLGQRRDGGKYTSEGRTTLLGGRIVAAKAFVALRVIWNHSKWRHEILPDCPVGVLSQVSRGWSRVGTRSSVVTDIPTFVATAWTYSNPIQRDLLLFLLATGLRMNEACQLRWSEVDLDAGTINIPAERMKAGRALHVPLTRMALECLQRRSEIGREEYVFIGRRQNGRAAHATVSKAMLKVLREAAGPFSPHSLRRTFTTIALGAGVPLQAVEVLTAHRSNGVTLNHYYRPSMDDLRVEVAKIDAALRT